MKKYNITDVIPIPEPFKVVVYPFEQMTVGQSFWLPVSASRMRNAASSYGRTHQQKFRVRVEIKVIKNERQRGARCWRVE